jgi:tetratricopeptide (TPR) repeat protein
MRALTHQDRETEQDYLTARQLLLQAIDRDKNFALAYVSLASSYTVMAVDGYARPSEAWAWVRRYAQQALKIDPALLRAHAELGSEALWNQWNWPLAEHEFQLASSNPESPAPLPYVLEQWAIGRPKDALRLIRQTRSIDPLSSDWRVKEADILHHAGEQDRAAAIYEGVVKDEPDDGRAYFGLAEVRGAQGRFDEAIDYLRQAYKSVGEDNETLLKQIEDARGEGGYRKIQRLEAQVELNRLSRQTGSPHYVSPLDFARAFARLGRREEAFTYLESAFEDHAPGLIFLKVDHAWDAIRDDPRFGRAVERVGLH